MLGWYVITGLNDPGVWFGCWGDAAKYLRTLNNRVARIIGPGCNPHTYSKKWKETHGQS